MTTATGVVVMMRITFSKESVKQLQDFALNHPHANTRSRALALFLKSAGIPHHRIQSLLNISGNTLRTYLASFMEGGLERLTETKYQGSESVLAPFEHRIRQYLTDTPPSSAKQARAAIEELTGISLDVSAIRRYIKSLGVIYRKVGAIPAKADVEQQEKFKTEQLEPRLDDAKKGRREVYFMDAAHFVLGAFLGFVWSFSRTFVKTPSGRQRFNVLGALNAVTKELITITNSTYITSTQVCELLKKIKLQATLPITIVLDNARYQRCKIVIGLAKTLNIELLFLPPYSPNLNLIERVWKFTKKECLNSRYYADFNLFRATIVDFLSSMHQVHEAELKSLLTLQFQTFTREQIRLAA
jgi:transposase